MAHPLPSYHMGSAVLLRAATPAESLAARIPLAEHESFLRTLEESIKRLEQRAREEVPDRVSYKIGEDEYFKHPHCSICLKIHEKRLLAEPVPTSAHTCDSLLLSELRRQGVASKTYEMGTKVVYTPTPSSVATDVIESRQGENYYKPYYDPCFRSPPHKYRDWNCSLCMRINTAERYYSGPLSKEDEYRYLIPYIDDHECNADLKPTAVVLDPKHCSICMYPGPRRFAGPLPKDCEWLWWIPAGAHDCNEELKPAAAASEKE